MNQVLFNWLLGIAATVLAAGIVGCLKACLQLRDDVHKFKEYSNGYQKLRDDVNNIKTTLSMMSEVAARALHSPDNHLGIDEYLEIYASHDCDMPNAKWEELKERLWIILNDKTKTTGERNAAGMLLFLSYHKLQKPLPSLDEVKARLKE